MSCALIDMGCHAAQIGVDLWGGLSLPSKLLIIIGLLSIAGGILWGAAKALKAFGGWPAVAGAAAVLLGLALAVWPKAASSEPPAAPAGSRPKAPTEFQFGVDRARPKKRTTIVDLFKGVGR